MFSKGVTSRCRQRGGDGGVLFPDRGGLHPPQSGAGGVGGKINEEAQAALRRGWYLGEESFKDKLLAMVDRARRGDKLRKAKTGVARAHGEGEAERLIKAIGKVLELPTEKRELDRGASGDGASGIGEPLARGDAEGGGWKKRLADLGKMLNSGG